MTFCTIWIYCNIYLFNFTKDISICLIFKPFQQQTLHISCNLSFISIFANIIHICQFEYSHPNSYVIVNFEDIFQYQLLQYKQRFGLQSTDRFSGDLHWQPEWPLAWGSGPACHCTLDCNFMLYQCSWHHTAMLVGKISSYNDTLAAQGQCTQLVHKEFSLTLGQLDLKAWVDGFKLFYELERWNSLPGTDILQAWPRTWLESQCQIRLTAGLFVLAKLNLRLNTSRTMFKLGLGTSATSWHSQSKTSTSLEEVFPLPCLFQTRNSWSN